MSTHANFENTISSLSIDIKAKIRLAAGSVNVSPQALEDAVIAEIAGEERRRNGRMRQWCVRGRLYSYDQGIGDPFLDSDNGLPADLPGEHVISGLGEVGKWVVEFAASYHGTSCAGLDPATITRRINSLRSQMSARGDGSGTMKLDYEVQSRFGSKHFLARCDVHRLALYPKPQPYVGKLNRPSYSSPSAFGPVAVTPLRRK